MSNGPWTDEENDLIVADYFAMLADDIAGHRYNKAEHRRALMPLLKDRSEGSVEFKHQNISAVLKGLTSRSNCAKLSKMFNVSRPMDVVVLKDWVTDTKVTP